MRNISHEINELLEQKSFEELSAAEQEMVLSQMSVDDYTERYELLQVTQNVFNEEGDTLIPDPTILNSLKEQWDKGDHAAPVNVHWIHKGVSIYKSAAAVLLAILGSYFLFGKTTSKVEYVVQEKIIEKKVYDTIFTERIVEVPVEKIVQIVQYEDRPMMRSVREDQVDFSMNKSERSLSNEIVELEDMNKSFGNSKIDEADLEQFRVSL